MSFSVGGWGAYALVKIDPNSSNPGRGWRIVGHLPHGKQKKKKKNTKNALPIAASVDSESW